MPPFVSKKNNEVTGDDRATNGSVLDMTYLPKK
jgi:hypothetical protein